MHINIYIYIYIFICQNCERLEFRGLQSPAVVTLSVPGVLIAMHRIGLCYEVGKPIA